LVIVTVAPATRAQLLSVTVPSKLAPYWAKADDVRKKKIVESRRARTGVEWNMTCLQGTEVELLFQQSFSSDPEKLRTGFRRTSRLPEPEVLLNRN
jgi:hypothetical protein